MKRPLPLPIEEQTNKDHSSLKEGEVPLTEQLLESYGFKMDGFHCFDFPVKEDLKLVLDLRQGYLWLREASLQGLHDDSLITLWNRDFNKEIYLYQLQNLYYALSEKQLIPIEPKKEISNTDAEILKKHYDFDEGFTEYEKQCVLAALEEARQDERNKLEQQIFSKDAFIEILKMGDKVHREQLDEQTTKALTFLSQIWHLESQLREANEKIEHLIN